MTIIEERTMNALVCLPRRMEEVARQLGRIADALERAVRDGGRDAGKEGCSKEGHDGPEEN